MKVPPHVTSGALSLFAGSMLLLLMQPVPGLAEGTDTANYVSKTLRCDGYDNNRCFRFADPRRRGKPYLQPRFHHPPPEGVDTRYVVERRPVVPYGEERWREREGRDRDYDRRDRDYDRRDRDYDRRDRYSRYDRYERYERECLHLVTAKGTEAQTENGALVSAKRAWRAWVRSDHGERYQDLDAAKNGEYRCWRSSTNESTIGKVGEFLTGQYRKRCQVWATPCLGERHTLDGDKDDRE
ncbi:MAG TPA: hypothetical protein VKF35_10780 [Hyphomicrobiaceae bacterium]|nr:hypothetical protein [Hyphomicrobiaceae bacterium]